MKKIDIENDAQIKELLLASKEASQALNLASSALRDSALAAIAKNIEQNSKAIIRANKVDIKRGASEGMSAALQDRLRLDSERITGLVNSVETIRSLDSPVGTVIRGMTLPNGLRVSQVSVPFGVIGAIYEARPNVTVDISALSLKSANAVILRGGSAAIQSNKVLISLIQEGLESVGLPPSAVASVDDFGRNGAQALMKARGYVDVLIPRGSASLIQTVVQESSVPVIETGSGVVHIYVDASADRDKAIEIIHNSKVQRPSVCNAVETVLIHREILGDLAPTLSGRLTDSGVTLHADEEFRKIEPGTAPALEEDWEREYLSMDLAVKTVSGIDEAIEHIRLHSSHHTESIVTEDLANAERFLSEVDSAVVMLNSSTRFTDGGEFGFGAEVGISTQKLHARGPMGLPELTSTKWIVRGQGQIRR